MTAHTSDAKETKPLYQQMVGVDIAALTFTASRLVLAKSTAAKTKPEAALSYQQTPTGFEKFEQLLLAKGFAPSASLIVMEATSTYWIGLAIFLHTQGFVVSVINPNQAHHFARAQLRRPKTDALDAQMLVQLGEALVPEKWSPPPQIYHELQQRLHHRHSLLELRKTVKNQLHALLASTVIVEAVREKMQSLIDTFSQQLEEVDTEIEEVIKQDSAWSKSITLLQTIPGVGPLTACWLVVATLNFSSCAKAEQLVQYAGLAPTERSSGSSIRGHAQIGHSGHPLLRAALYMAAMSASRWNAVVKAFYDKLRTAGKPMKVARIAAARKLVHLAFAVVKSGKEFDLEYAAKKQTEQLAKAS